MKTNVNPPKQNPKIDTFIGLMDENGAIKGSYGNYCKMKFTLCAYIKNGGALREEKLVVSKDIPDFDYPTQGLEPLTIVEFTGEEISFQDQNSINLLTIVKTKAHHPELEKVLQRRREPVSFQSSRFGSFTLDRNLGWYEGRVKWRNQEIDLYLDIEENSPAELENQAIQLFDKQLEWDKKLKNKIVEDLLELKNDDWLEEGEKPLTEEEFLEKIELQSLTMDGDGDFEAWFHDGDTFWGHSICIYGNLNGELNEVGIHG